MPLLSGSPAIGAGDASLLPPDAFDLDGDGNTTERLPVDQRGQPRVVGASLDIGAYEFPAQRQLLSVFARGSAWSGTFKQYLSDQRMGDAALGYRINAGDTLPWINVDQLALRFDRELPTSPLPQHVTLHGVRSDYAATPSVLDSRTILLTFDRPIGGGGDRLRLDDDALGDAPDLHFNVLPGDANRAGGRVNALDLGYEKARLNRAADDPPQGSGAQYTPFADLNGDGRINAIDLGAVKARLNSSLPDAAAALAPPPAAAAPPLAPSATRDWFTSTPIFA